MVFAEKTPSFPFANVLWISTVFNIVKLNVSSSLDLISKQKDLFGDLVTRPVHNLSIKVMETFYRIFYIETF